MAATALPLASTESFVDGTDQVVQADLRQCRFRIRSGGCRSRKPPNLAGQGTRHRERHFNAGLIRARSSIRHARAAAMGAASAGSGTLTISNREMVSRTSCVPH